MARKQTRQQIEAKIRKLQQELCVIENNETVFTVEVGDSISGPITRTVSRAVATNLFNMVADKANWKNPIDATVTIFDTYHLKALERAITFFVGSVPSIVCVGGNLYRVRAAGYYVDIGA